jgi:uncharacterized protein YgiM (DUF1202 family)
MSNLCTSKTKFLISLLVACLPVHLLTSSNNNFFFSLYNKDVQWENAMKKRERILIFTLVLALFLACACSFSLPVNPTPTLDIIAVQLAQHTIEAAFTETALVLQPVTQTFEAPSATSTPIPTRKQTATITLSVSTPTEIAPVVSVSINTNCRSGPNIVYDYQGALLVGERTIVIGKHPEKAWLLVKNPDKEGNCWITSQYATVSGDISNLPVPELPPFYDWNGLWKFTQFQVGTDLNLTLVQTGVNVSGSYSFSGSLGTISGSLSDNGQVLNGSLELENVNGSFPIYFKMMDNMKQFIGSADINFTSLNSCGYRENAGYPSGCPLP